MGTSSFEGEQKAVTQQAHSFWPQWDKYNNGRDQCTQGQQRTDKEFLKDQQACFTIYTALQNPLWKHYLNNLIDLKIRSAFTYLFCWYSVSAVTRLWLFNEMLFVTGLKSTVGPVVCWICIRCDTDLMFSHQCDRTISNFFHFQSFSKAWKSHAFCI